LVDVKILTTIVRLLIYELVHTAQFCFMRESRMSHIGCKICK